jgi:putative transposase
VEARLKELVEKVCTDQGLGLLSIEIQPDYIYLHLETSPQYGVHKAVKTLKAVTSRALRGEFHHLTTKLPTLWTNSYFVSTDESPPWDRIREYISEQKTSQRK